MQPNQLKEVALSILDDANSYLNQISVETYCQPQELLFNASIGQHTRHFIEFFQCLLEQSKKGDCINYDKRERNKMIEQQPEYTLAVIEELKVALLAVNLDRTLRLEASYSGTEAAPLAVSSNFEREMLYNVEHTVHHLAIIKIGLKAVAPEIVLPDNFGVAASTVRFRQNA